MDKARRGGEDDGSERCAAAQAQRQRLARRNGRL